MLKPIPWDASATIVAHRYKPYRGTLLGCLRQWSKLPDSDKTTALICLDVAAFGNAILNVRDIRELTAKPEFYSH